MNMAKDVYEGVRKAMLEVFIPEIKKLQEEVAELRGDMNLRFSEMNLKFEKLEQGQKAILDKLDLAQRLAKLEGQFAELSKKVA